MCDFAESLNNYDDSDVVFPPYPLEKPLEFKPGLGDRFLFNRFVKFEMDEWFTILKMAGKDNRKVIDYHTYNWGIAIMGKNYYINYEWFDRKQLEEAKCST